MLEMLSLLVYAKREPQCACVTAGAGGFVGPSLAVVILVCSPEAHDDECSTSSR